MSPGEAAAVELEEVFCTKKVGRDCREVVGTETPGPGAVLGPVDDDGAELS